MSTLCRRLVDEEGVSEVVGTILTLGITVVLFSSIYATVATLDSPEQRDHVEMVAEYERVGDMDYINITHQSGRGLDTDSLVFNLLADGASETRFRIDDTNVSLTGEDDDTWSVGEGVTIKGKIFGKNDENLELLIQNEDTNRVVYQTVLVEEIPGQLDIKRAYFRYIYEWRNYAEQGEEVDIVAELSNVGDDVDVYVTVSEDYLWVDEDSDEDIEEGEEIKLERESRNRYLNESIQIRSNATEKRYSVRVIVENGNETEEWVRLNVGKKAAERYPKELEIGRVEFIPPSISHGSELEVMFEVYNHADVNYTTKWEIYDDYNDNEDDDNKTDNKTYGEETFEHGPAPTEVSGSFDIKGSGEHTIKIVVEGDDEWEGAERAERINVDPHILVVEDESASDMYEAELMTNSLDGLNLDYDFKELTTEDLPDDDEEAAKTLSKHSIVVWMTGEKDGGEGPNLVNHSGALESYIDNYDGAVWVTGQNFGNENLSGRLAHDGDGLNDGPDQPYLSSEDENGTFGDYEFKLSSRNEEYNSYYHMDLDPDKEYNDTLEDKEGNSYGAGYELDKGQRTVVTSFLLTQMRDPGLRTGFVAEVIEWATDIDARSGKDVGVTSQEIDPSAPMYLDQINVTATFRNNGNKMIRNLENTARLVRNQGEDVIEPNLDENETINLEPNGGSATVNFTWVATELGVQELLVHADYYGQIGEVNLRNNDIKYKNLDITDDQIYVNVHFSTLVVDAGGTNSVKQLNQSFQSLGYQEGQDFVIDNFTNGELEEEDMSEYNAVIWVTSSSGITQDEVDEILSYLQDSGGNLMLIGENILDDLSSKNNGDDLLTHLGIDPDDGIHSEEVSPNKVIGQKGNKLGHALRYEVDTSSIDTFESTSTHGEVLFKDQDGNNIASTYDDGESNKTAYIGFSLDNITGPLVDEDAFEDWPSGEVSMTKENATTEFAYTSVWYFGKTDESLEIGPEGEPRRRTELRVTDYDITPSSYQPHTGRSYQIKVTIENIGYKGASTLVRIHEGEDYVGSENLFVEGSTRESEEDSAYFDVEPGRATAEVNWRSTDPGTRPLIVRVDSEREVAEIVNDTEEGTGEGRENKIMEFNNAARIDQPVYFFYDDMERGENNWRHDETLLNIDGTGPLDLADRWDMETNVVGNWSDDYSGMTLFDGNSYNETDGTYETDEEGVEKFTDKAHYSNPRSYWMPETPSDDNSDIPEGYEEEINLSARYRYLTTHSIDVEDTTAQTLRFRTKFWMSQDTAGGMIYLWGKNDTYDWEWNSANRENRTYIKPQQGYPGDLDLPENPDGPNITGETGGLEYGEGEDIPEAVFNGKSASGTFGWRYISADLSQYENFMDNHDEIRVVFLTAQIGNASEGDWYPEMGWYIDNVQVRVTREFDGAVPDDGNGYWMRVNESEVQEKFPGDIDEKNYTDNTPGEDGDGYYWMFAQNNSGEPALPKGVDASLYTSRIDLSNAENPRLNAHVKFNLDNRSGVPPPGFRIDISEDGGRSWDELTYGVRGGWGVSGDNEHGNYSGVSDEEGYGWVHTDTLTRIDAELDGWRDEIVMLRFRVFTNLTTETYENEDYPKAIFIDDVIVKEADMEAKELQSSTTTGVLEDSKSSFDEEEKISLNDIEEDTESLNRVGIDEVASRSESIDYGFSTLCRREVEGIKSVLLSHPLVVKPWR
ncbi:MAG: type IV pilin [Candidatus Thermoplasmatota archaeon]|nr:type IV pilin [Candidatus Thermoplasmatota archaeon]